MEKPSTPGLLLLLLDAHLQNKGDFMQDGSKVKLVFRLLLLGDLCTSMAWHSTWRASARIP